jgi:3-phenylpropionate/trans-cinnamate dioxygenase ferredoxin reductase subunit
MVIVGAGQSGLQVAEALRSEGWPGRIVVVGDEAHLPYHRPPLSKAYLLGEAGEAQLTIRSADALARKAIELLPGTVAVAIDRARRRIALAGGRELPYASLALATGGRPRPLACPGAAGPGVLALRTLDDCRAIAAALVAAQRVVVIGGGFIGLEFAAVARSKGKAVTVLELADRLMARAVAPVVSDFYARLHRGRGVAVITGCGDIAIERNGGAIGGVRAGGLLIPADLVVAGVGIVPNVELAAAAGLAVDCGIVVDACSRTSDPSIVACGDCTATRLPDGALRRLESVQNAVEQAKAAAASLVGRDKPFTAAPWFWSDQYDTKLQMVGTSAGHDRMLLRGSPPGERFAAFYFRAGKLIGIDTVNRPQEHMTGRKLLDRGITPTPEQVADEGFALASLVG